MAARLVRNTVAALGLLVAATTTSSAQLGRMEFLVPGGHCRGSGRGCRAARAFENAEKGEPCSGTQVTSCATVVGMIAISQFLTTKKGNANAVVTQGAGGGFRCPTKPQHSCAM